jgi:hypothetical protein
MGFGPPVSFTPYLEDLAQHFLMKPGKKVSFQSVKPRTEVPDVELIAPNRVYVPGGR